MRRSKSCRKSTMTFHRRHKGRICSTTTSDAYFWITMGIGLILHLTSKQVQLDKSVSWNTLVGSCKNSRVGKILTSNVTQAREISSIFWPSGLDKVKLDLWNPTFIRQFLSGVAFVNWRLCYSKSLSCHWAILFISFKNNWPCIWLFMFVCSNKVPRSRKSLFIVLGLCFFPDDFKMPRVLS